MRAVALAIFLSQTFMNRAFMDGTDLVAMTWVVMFGLFVVCLAMGW